MKHMEATHSEPVGTTVAMGSRRPVSIVIADDHKIVSEGVALICGSQPQFEVIGQCWDGLSALEMIRSLRPDVAVLDLNMPGLHGIELIRQIRKSDVPTKIIVLSLTRDLNVVQDAFRSGANAFLLKDGPHNHLLAAIRHTLEGGVYVSPLLDSIRLFQSSPKGRSGDNPLDLLSSRERQVMGLLVEGLRAKDVAAQLQISPKTVDTYRSSLMRKLSIDGSGSV